MSLVGSAIELIEINSGYRKQGGSYREWVYEGTQQAILTAYSSFFGTGQSSDLIVSKVGNNKWRLVVRRDDVTPGTAPILHTVRLINHRVQKSIFEPPLPDDLWAVTDGEIAQIQEELRKRTSTSAAVDPPWFPSVSAQARVLFSLALRGVKYRIVYQPHLIRQTVGINSRIYEVSFENIGKIFTTAQVIVDAGISSPLRWNLPNDDWNSVGGTPAIEDFAYGWVKHGVNIEPGPENMEVLTQEYEYGLWSLALYDLAP